MEKQTQRLIRAPQAANLLDLRLPRLYELARRNLIPGLVRIGDKALRFDLLALERFISRGGLRQNETKQDHEE
ncbi:MAG TPA: hypothetical protein VIG25_23300 [Pyrinomonadaceae bacterium]